MNDRRPLRHKCRAARARRVLLGCMILAAAGATAAPNQAESQSRADAGRLIASPEAGWPQWRGPRRDGISDETGLLQRWPEAGPELTWEATGLGRGYSAPIVAGGRIFLAGDFGPNLKVMALDLAGSVLWSVTNGRAWANPYPGARSSCAYADGRVFHLNAHGRLACLAADTGAELWAVNVLDRFDGRNITWGLSESLLVDRGLVFVTPGGKQALMAALDAKTGRTVWTTPPLRLGEGALPAHERVAEPKGEADGASYASAILFMLNGQRQIASCSLRHAFGVDADTGALLWTRPLPGRYKVIATTPVLCGDAVFVTAPDAGGGKLFRLQTGTNGTVHPQTAWATPLDTGQGGAVAVGNMLVGSFYRTPKRWVGLDIATGAVQAELRGLVMGSIVHADRRLYCLTQDGEMALLLPGPTQFQIVSRFRLVPKHSNDVWTHPVICGGRLYLRYHGTLFCYRIEAPE